MAPFFTAIEPLRLVIMAVQQGAPRPPAMPEIVAVASSLPRFSVSNGLHEAVAGIRPLLAGVPVERVPVPEANSGAALTPG